MKLIQEQIVDQIHMDTRDSIGIETCNKVCKQVYIKILSDISFKIRMGINTGIKDHIENQL